MSAKLIFKNLFDINLVYKNLIRKLDIGGRGMGEFQGAAHEGAARERQASAQEMLAMGFLDGLVGYRIRLAQIAAFKDFEAVAKGFGQAPRYFGLLSLIEANPGLPQGKLAEAVHLVRSSLVPIIDKLAGEGLVERRSSNEDRRLKAVWLTPKGAKVLARLRPQVLAHEDRLTLGFSESEKAMLIEMLRRLDGNLRRKASSAAAA